MTEQNGKPPRRWQKLIAGMLLMLLAAAPLINAGVMLVYEQTFDVASVHGRPAPFQGWLALAAGLGLMALSLWLFAAEFRMHAKTGWARAQQSLGTISFMLICLGITGAGQTSAPQGGFYTLYQLCLLTGLGLNLLSILAEAGRQLLRRVRSGHP
ncbi:MAG: hypothetical protein ACAI44_19325 [Candidatus Sericytochromatia bacterium]